MTASEGIIVTNPPDTVFPGRTRTCTESATGTCGQGIPRSLIPAWNTAATVNGIRTTGGFRTNSGVFAVLSAQSFLVVAEVHDKNGVLVERKDSI